MRTIRWEHVTDEQVAAIGCGFKRYDEMMEFAGNTLCMNPEMFPSIPGTKLRICRTNDFCGVSFPDIPPLTLFFYFDQWFIYLAAVDVGTEYDKEIS